MNETTLFSKILIIILAIAIVFGVGYFIFKLASPFTYIDEGANQSTFSLEEQSTQLCIAIVTMDSSLCNEIALNESKRQSCIVKILRKKAAFEKNKTHCLQINKYPESEPVRNKEPYEESCAFMAQNNEELRGFDCSSLEDEKSIKLCLNAKRTIFEEGYDITADTSLTLSEQTNLLKFKASYFQDPSVCDAITETEFTKLKCIASTTSDTEFCSEYGLKYDILPLSLS